MDRMDNTNANTTPIPSEVQLAYATPAPASGSGLAAGVWITLAGLALIFLGGCFCIGVMIALNAGNINGGFGPGSTTPTASNAFFIALLIVLAFACFGSAGVVLYLGIRKLLSIGR